MTGNQKYKNVHGIIAKKLLPERCLALYHDYLKNYYQIWIHLYLEAIDNKLYVKAKSYPNCFCIWGKTTQENCWQNTYQSHKH